MRSLKIIFFRDTDKPYTVILSSKVLIGISFSVIALISLLTFSIMSNVLILTEESAIGNEGELEQMTDSLREPDVRTAPAEENSGEGQSTAAEDINRESQEAESSDEAPETEAEEPASRDLENWSAPECPFTVSVIGSPALGQSSVSIRTLVGKIVEAGRRESGRYVAVLANESGELGPTYPSGIAIDGYDIVNPERGRLFTIANSIEISLDFSGVNVEDYESLVIFIYDEETKGLLWKSVEPLR